MKKLPSIRDPSMEVPYALEIIRSINAKHIFLVDGSIRQLLETLPLLPYSSHRPTKTGTPYVDFFKQLVHATQVQNVKF